MKTINDACLRNELDKDIYISRLRWISYIDAMKSAQAIWIYCEMAYRMQSMFFNTFDTAMRKKQNIRKDCITEMLKGMVKDDERTYNENILSLWRALRIACSRFESKCRVPLQTKALSSLNFFEEIMENYNLDTWKEESDDIEFQKQIKECYSQANYRWIKENFPYLIVFQRFVSSLVEGVIFLEYQKLVPLEEIGESSLKKIEDIIKRDKDNVKIAGTLLIKKYKPDIYMSQTIDLDNFSGIKKKVEKIHTPQFKSWLDQVTSRKDQYKALKEQLCEPDHAGRGIKANKLYNILKSLGFTLTAYKNYYRDEDDEEARKKEEKINADMVSMLFVSFDQLQAPDFDKIDKELEKKKLKGKERAALRKKMIQEQTISKVNQQKRFKQVFPIPEYFPDTNLAKFREDPYLEEFCFEEMNAVTEGILNFMSSPHLVALNERIYPAFACTVVANTIPSDTDKALEVFNVELEDGAEDEEDWDDDWDEDEL